MSYPSKRENELNGSIENLYLVNLGVKKNESILVFTDYLVSDEVISVQDRKRREGLLSLVERVAKIGEGLCKVVFFTYPSLKGHGIEPPEELWKAAFGQRIFEALKDRGFMDRLLMKESSPEFVEDVEDIVRGFKEDVVDGVIALSNYSTSHTRFRDLLTSCAQVRFASMPLFDEEMFYGPMMVDWSALAERTEILARALSDSQKVEILAPNGTNLRISTKGREIMADTGVLTIPGSFGNLPAGEVFLAPEEGMTEGHLVLEWAPTLRLKFRVTLEIKEGMVREVYGEDSYAKELKEVLSRDDNFRNVAELGIGTNDMAKRPDNILESEKILGTIHIALGDNSSFGGTVCTPFHTDYVVFSPTLDLQTEKGEMKRLLEEGRLLYEGEGSNSY